VGGEFGNGVAVLIRGKMIACDSKDKTFLVTPAARVSLDLSCESPLGS
jgi:hypothetical protein